MDLGTPASLCVRTCVCVIMYSPCADCKFFLLYVSSYVEALYAVLLFLWDSWNSPCADCEFFSCMYLLCGGFVCSKFFLWDSWNSPCADCEFFLS